MVFWPAVIDVFRDVPVRPVHADARTRVWIADDLVRAFARDAADWAPRETGGALLGYRNDEGVVVTDLVPGGPQARHRRGYFLPDARWQERQIRERYLSSGRVARYLGDVHSHPAGDLALSRRDRRTARRIAQHPAAVLPRPLMLLFASAQSHWQIAAWEYVDRALQRCNLYALPRSELVELTDRGTSTVPHDARVHSARLCERDETA